MPQYRLYHNPKFVEYALDPRHDDIVLPERPVATITLQLNRRHPADLELVYERSQHMLNRKPWYLNPGVMPHIRSTSVGDVIEAPDGTFFVVERAGFMLMINKPKTLKEHLAKLLERYHAVCDNMLAYKDRIDKDYLANATLAVLSQINRNLELLIEVQDES